MNPVRALRRAWVAVIAGIVFGFGYFVLVPPGTSRITDSVLAVGTVVLGAVVGVWLEIRIERMMAARRSAAASGDPHPVRTESRV